MIENKLINELRDYLDSQEITSDNIGNMRRQLFVPWHSEWNGIVRDETAVRENNSLTNTPRYPTSSKKYTEDELIRLYKSVEKLTKLGKRFCIDYGYDNANDMVDSLEITAQCWCKPETKNIEMDSQLATEFAKKLGELKELHNIQLSAISVTSLMNTSNSKKDRLNRENPYWTLAYQDTCDAVDREIQERNRANNAEEIIKKLEISHDELAKKYDELLYAVGKKYPNYLLNPVADARKEPFCGYCEEGSMHTVEDCRKYLKK